MARTQVNGLDNCRGFLAVTEQNVIAEVLTNRFNEMAYILRADCDLVVPDAFAFELNAVEQFDVAHKACHHQAALRPVKDFGDLRNRRLSAGDFLKSVLVVLIKLVNNYVVVVLVGLVEFGALDGQTDEQAA